MQHSAIIIIPTLRKLWIPQLQRSFKEMVNVAQEIPKTSLCENSCMDVLFFSFQPPTKTQNEAIIIMDERPANEAC